MFSEDSIAQGEHNLTLGPAYFEACKVAERAMEHFKDEHFKPLIEDFSKAFADKLWSDVCSSLLADTEVNLHQEMWSMVDSVVEAILGGRKWALQKYVLNDRYNCEEVRAAVAKYIPVELQAARIADLEAENARLKDDADFYRNR